MIGTNLIILHTENGTREILPSPLMLHAKNPLADIKNGKITKIFFYENWTDEAYKAYLEKEAGYLKSFLNTDTGYVINYGQDFGKYYIGYVNIDPDSKTYSIQEDQADKSDELKVIADLLFTPDEKARSVIIIQPTKPSEIKLTRFDDIP